MYKWVKLHHGYGYFIGDICNLSDEVALSLLQDGYIIKVNKEQKEQPKKARKMKVKREIYCGDLPLSLERFKKHLRMNEDEFDEDLMLKLKAAFLNAEKYISTYLITSDFTIEAK
jgi:hypothetical protein